MILADNTLYPIAADRLYPMAADGNNWFRRRQEDSRTVLLGQRSPTSALRPGGPSRSCQLPKCGAAIARAITVMRAHAYKVLLLLLVFGVVTGPYVHALVGCDDDSPAASSKELASRRVDQGCTKTTKHRGLPDGACCALALAVATFAYSGHPALPSASADSVKAPALMVVSVPLALDLLGADATSGPRHPPPSSGPIFLRIRTLLI